MNTTMIRAIVITLIATIAAIVTLALFRPGDNTFVILQIVAVVAPTTAALLALLKSSENSAQIADNTAKTEHLAITVDGRLSQLLEARGEAMHAAGVHQGEQDERDRSGTISGPTTIAAEGPTTISTEGPITVVGKTDVTKDL